MTGNRQILLILILIASMHQLIAQDNEFDILNDWVEWSNGENMLQKYLNNQAYSMIDERDKEVSLLETEGDWRERQAKVKEIYAGMIGEFPKRDSIKARIQGIIIKDNFRIEIGRAHV